MFFSCAFAGQNCAVENKLLRMCLFVILCIAISTIKALCDHNEEKVL